MRFDDDTNEGGGGGGGDNGYFYNNNGTSSGITPNSARPPRDAIVNDMMYYQGTPVFLRFFRKNRRFFLPFLVVRFARTPKFLTDFKKGEEAVLCVCVRPRVFFTYAHRDFIPPTIVMNRSDSD